MKTPEVHPLAKLFPSLPKRNLERMSKDIKANGLMNPILLLDGKVIDGKNRLVACKLAGVEPAFKELDWNDEARATQLVESLNIHRRHLTESQRSMIAAKLSDVLRKSLKNNGTTAATVATSDESVASEMKVSKRSVRRARVVIQKGVKKLKKMVEEGKLPVHPAEKIARLPKKEQSEIVRPRNAAHAMMLKAKELEASERKPKHNPYVNESKEWKGTTLTDKIRENLVQRINKQWPEKECTMDQLLVRDSILELIKELL